MDAQLFRKVNMLANRTGWLHGPALAYAKDGLVLFALFLVWAWWRARSTADLHTEAGIGWAGASALLALGAAQVVGHLVDRARPYEAMPHIHVLIAKTADFSFPSDHATTVGALAVGLWLVDRPVGTVAVVAALLMAITRVYVGAHYPADVLAGLLLGGLIAFLGLRPATTLLEWLLHQLRRIPGVVLLTGRSGEGDREPT